MNFECENCKADLQAWNLREDTKISFCPDCGTAVPVEQKQELYDKTNISEIDGIIRESLLEALEWIDENELDDLVFKAFESENINGAFFCSYRKAELFIKRHSSWVEDGRATVEDYDKADPDSMLVVLFINAAEHYIGNLTGRYEDKEELKELIEKTEYDGGFVCW